MVAVRTSHDLCDRERERRELNGHTVRLGCLPTEAENATTFIHLKAAQYVNDLVAVQDGDGSWGDPSGDTQLTAYAILGIDPHASTTALKLAVKEAATFLVNQQIPGTVPNPGGGFDNGSGIENTEVDGEVLQALNAAH